MKRQLKAGVVIHGNFFELAKCLRTNSVDMIWGDPIYMRPEDYRDTIHVAARILKPGGHCILQTASYYRFEAERLMYAAEPELMTPRSLLIERWPRQWLGTWRDLVTVGMRPYIWMSKKKNGLVARHGHWIPDNYLGNGRQKKLHAWGDSTAFPEFYLSKLVPKHGVVVDPFAGSGLITSICLKLRLICYAFEIDRETCKQANHNIKARLHHYKETAQ